LQVGGIRGRWAVGAWGLAAALAAAYPAQAAAAGPDVPIPLSIVPQPRASALVALGRQSGLTIGFPADLDCPGQASAVGRMSPRQGLDLLLRGSECVAVQLDARTFVIRSRVAAASGRDLPPPTPAPPARELESLVITATKRESVLGSSPYSVSAVTAETLRRQDVEGVGALSALVAGLTVTNLGPGRDKIALRGLSDSALSGHTQSTVGIYLDDLRLTYNAPDPDLPWVDVRRVEVLRGPQGSLYGSGSIGGILHVVTREPDPAQAAGWIEAAAAVTAHGAPSHGFRAMLNQPLPLSGAAVRIAAWWDETGGVIENSATGMSDVDLSRRHGVRVTGAWSARPDLTVSASVIQQSINSRDAQYAQGSRPYVRATRTPEPHDNDFLAVDLSLRWTPSWGAMTLNSAVVRHNVISRYDAALAPVALAPDGDTPRTYDDGNEIDGVVNEFRAVSVSGARLQWLVGAFTALGAQELSGALTGASGRTGYREVRHDRTLERALFGEATYDLGPTWSLTAGGRFFSSHVSTRSTVSAAAGSDRFDGEFTESGFAPKVLAAYRPASTLTIYAVASKGYRLGGFNTSGPLGQPFGDQPGMPQPLREFAGDRLWNYEAGVRWASPGGGASLRAAVFRAVWTQVQADLVLPSGLPFTANVGDGHSSGVEVEASALTGPLSLAANLTLQDPAIDKPDPGFPGREDAHLPGVPRLSFGLTADYSRPIAAGLTLELSSRFTYIGTSRLTFDERTAPAMGGYGELHASVGFRSPRGTLEIFADNLTNAQANTFAFGNPFSFRVTAQSTPLRPLSLGLRLRRRF